MIFKYRVGGGRNAAQCKLLLGTYGAITVDQARTLAHQAQAEIVKGGDPAGARADHRRAATVREFSERYLAEHADLKKGTISAREDRRLIDRHVIPKIGTREVVDLAATDIAKVVHGLSATPILANRVRALLSKMLSLAVVWGLRVDPLNPARLVQKFPETSRGRYLSTEELKRLGEVLSDLERNTGEPWQAIAAIRLLLSTGCRKTEILSLRWEFASTTCGIPSPAKVLAWASASPLLAGCQGTHSRPRPLNTLISLLTPPAPQASELRPASMSS